MLDFLTKPKERNENYWALLIESNWISSAVWQITDGKVEIVSASPATRWEEDLLGAVDSSLSACTQNLDENVKDPTKTVFGVPNLWVEDGNIKQEYLEKLKNICRDLSLIPSGFVILSEAISHFVKQEEEVPLSGIVVGFNDEIIDISIFELGKLMGVTNVARSISVEDDIHEGLSRLSQQFQNFPSRLILYNQKEQELEEIKNSLNNVDWEKVGEGKFIHTPRVEIFDPGKKIPAIALAGGSEMEAVSGIRFKGSEPDTIIGDHLGEEIENVEEPQGITAKDLGFSVVEDKDSEKAQAKIKLPKFSLQLPKLNFSNIIKSMPNFSLGKKPLVYGGLIILTLLLVGFAMWWVLPKATVILYVTPQKLEESVVLTAGDDIETENISVLVSGEKIKPTTGTKTVGDKAKGQVKVQNGTAFPINLSSGTILVSSSDLKFVTTQSASVSGALSPSDPGIATLDIEALNIGSEYNLPKDEIFKVDNYPKAEVDARSTDSFSGGSSREIQAVSSEDRNLLMDELKTELLEEAKNKLDDQVDSSKILVDSSLSEEITDENFSNKVGDEATNLKLSMELKFIGMVVTKSDLTIIARKNIEARIPSGFVLRDDQIIFDFGEADEEGQLKVRIVANLLPTVNVSEISKNIAGRYPNLAKDYLTSVPGFFRAEFRIKPHLFGKLGTLPHLSKNISVEVSSEQ